MLVARPGLALTVDKDGGCAN